MITEDYVSFETAKLLKEKGFDEPTTKSYYTEGFENPMIFSHDLLSCTQTDEFLCPTLQMVMKWLREVYHITIGITFSLNIITYEIQKNGEFIIAVGSSRSYEDMVEEAIKCCLKNLI